MRPEDEDEARAYWDNREEMTDLEAVSTIAQTAAADAVRALREIEKLRVEMQAEVERVYAIHKYLLDALLLIVRNEASPDDCTEAIDPITQAGNLVYRDRDCKARSES
jgi:GTP cyclohydrolase III